MAQKGRKILLKLDNALVNPVDVEYSNIELLYFPLNVTSRIPTLDQGIIKSFKSIYRKKLNHKLNIEYDLDSTKEYYDLLKKNKIFDALLLIIDSWNELSAHTIIRCYRKALENSQINSKTLLSIPDIEEYTNSYTCYPENLTEEVFFY
ncbi:Tigger transposable element-derived protein 1 [Dictyocoela muelleri]|nr:Tigger transposable element-derived protein 1 [Dictyocoela muelleri]